MDNTGFIEFYVKYEYKSKYYFLRMFFIQKRQKQPGLLLKKIKYIEKSLFIIFLLKNNIVEDFSI